MRQASDAAVDQGHGRTGGRKGSGGTKEVPDFQTVKQATADLMRRYKKMQNAKDDYNDAVAKVAERTNTNARNLNKLIKSSEKGTFADVRRDIDQLGSLFEIVGEVAGGPSTAPDDEK